HTRWPRDWSADVCSSDLQISRVKNPELKDKSDREGLVDNPASREFVIALHYALHVLETERAIDKPAMGRARLQPQGEIEISRLVGAARKVARGESSAKRLVKIAEAESARLEETRKALKMRLAIFGRMAAIGQL